MKTPYVRLSVEMLRASGHDAEADRLDAAVERARLWNGSAVESAVALGLFGSVEYDRLAAASS